MIYLEADSVKELYEKLAKFDNVHSIQILKEEAKIVCIAQDEPIKVMIEHDWAKVDGIGLPVWINGGIND
jgi:hypothetical protein